MGLLDRIADWQRGIYEQEAAMRRQSALQMDQALTAQRQAQQAELLKPTLSRFGTETAAQLGGLLLSDSPDARALGSEQLSGLMERAGQVSPAMARAIEYAQLQQQGQVLANTAAGMGIQQAGVMGPLQQQQARNAIALQEGQLAAAYKSALEAAKPQPSLPYGEPAKGYFAAVSPSGEAEYIPQPGTEPYNAAIGKVRLLEEALRSINQLQASVEKAGASGTELVGPLANTLRYQRGNVLSTVAKLRDLGVLQPGEYEVLESQLPDPTGFMRNIMALHGALDPTGNLFELSRSSIQEPYTKMRQEMELRLREARNQYWYVPKIPTLPEEAAARR